MTKELATRLPEAPNLQFEVELWEEGFRLVAGVDEVGRGALAGPVAAGILILPPDRNIQSKLKGMHDSKKHTPAQREEFAQRIHDLAMAFGTGFASAEEIDKLGIVPATRLAMQNAIAQLKVEVDYLLIDFIRIPESPIPQISMIKGDERSLSIAGASILAKVSRDAFMRQLDELYPEYGFSDHKGYGTLKHRLALNQFGPCPIHRLSFRLNPPTF